MFVLNFVLLVALVVVAPVIAIDVNAKLYAQTFPSSCQEAIKQNNLKSGIFLIQVPKLRDPFYVNCIPDPQGGAVWTLIQRRINGELNFFRNWNDYERGFGELEAEFYFGLTKLHALTSFQPHELWIQLMDYQGYQWTAKYNAFAVGDSYSKYALSTLGTYSGNATDGLSSHKGQKFSTKDHDNDASTSNCAEIHKGAWWFKNCLTSHLNGLYYGYGYKSGSPISDIFWTNNGSPSNSKSYNYVHMAIRAKTSK